MSIATAVTLTETKADDGIVTSLEESQRGLRITAESKSDYELLGGGGTDFSRPGIGVYLGKGEPENEGRNNLGLRCLVGVRRY
jgi:hypothetical protein